MIRKCHKSHTAGQPIARRKGHSTPKVTRATRHKEDKVKQPALFLVKMIAKLERITEQGPKTEHQQSNDRNTKQ